jgi:Domain of unknown function (DUF4394)/FG-GAP repeat
MRTVGFVTTSAVAALLWMAGPAEADVIYALAPPYFLVQFDSAAPGTLTRVAFVSGLQSGERLEAIDFRPRTGQLFGLGIIDGVTDTLRLYTINPLTGAATLVPGSTPVIATNGNSYGFDFNPTVDRIRVVNNGDENLRLNPNTGARADTPTNDIDLNGAGNQIMGAAYDRNFDSGLAVANRTTLYAISASGSALVTIGGVNQSPNPNGGAVTNALPLGVTLAATGDVGFDIAAGSGIAYAALRSAATGLTGLYTINLGTGAANFVGLIGNGAFNVTGLAAVPANTLVSGAGPGGGPHVRVFDAHSGALSFEFFAFTPGFTGGVRVATGDVTGDGVPDIITAAGPGGGPHVRVFNGVNGAQLGGLVGSFLAYDPAFPGGVWVAAGDVNADGNKDVIVGPGAGGGPDVRVISGANSALIAEFFAYAPEFPGGVRVASADFDRDGDYEIITAPGPGGGPHIKVFDGAGNLFTSASLPNFVNSFFAYSSGFSGGVFVAAGDVNGDGVPDIITGAGAGGGPHVRAISGVNGAIIVEFFAYELSFSGGVQVAVADVNGDGRYEIITTPGPGRPAEVRAFDGVSGALLQAFQPYGAFQGGAFIGGVRR